MDPVFFVPAIFGVGFFVFASIVALVLRRVVPTNEVHIVQSAKTTTSYGKGTDHGNVYYEWPSFLPVFGVTKSVLPVSNFDIDLDSYEAYDEGRLPFVVHIKAFFRVANPNEAAQRVASFSELLEQLRAVVQGAVRTILASNSIEEIMQGRSKFGNLFTEEVKHQLASWGVETIKNIEMMDIRDSKDSKVIHNIMEKKKSQIEAESRTAVAGNHRAAQMAEIAAKQATDVAAQDAAQAVGKREIEVKLSLEQQRQEAAQMVSELARVSKEKEMAVTQVATVRQAEITRDEQVVKAEQQRRTSVISAEAARETLKLEAEGRLEAKRREAEGITLEGEAKASAEKALQLAPVQAQIVLAQEIGGNAGYQTYLIRIREVEATQLVGMEQAKALAAANIKVIATSDTASSGLTAAGGMISAAGGTQIAAALEAFANSETGERVVNAVLPTGKK